MSTDKGTLPTKGTRLYFAVSASEILKVRCATGIQGLGGAATKLDETCLESEEMESRPGLRDPSEVTVPVNFTPRSASHQAILDLEDSQEKISWMIVCSDQAGAPTTVDSDDRLVSPGSTTIEFLGYISNTELDIQNNELVRGTITIQRSGAKNLDLPAADLP